MKPDTPREGFFTKISYILVVLVFLSVTTACKKSGSSNPPANADTGLDATRTLSSEVSDNEETPDPVICEQISNYHQIYSLTQSVFVSVTGLVVRTNTGQSFEVPITPAVYDMTNLLGFTRGIPLNLKNFDIPGNQTEVDIVEVEILLDSSSAENKVTSQSEPDCALKTANSIHVFTTQPIRVAEDNDYLIKISFDTIDHVQFNNEPEVVCEEAAQLTAMTYSSGGKKKKNHGHTHGHRGGHTCMHDRGVCKVTAGSLEDGRRKFEEKCNMRYDKSKGHDCDPVNSGWLCASSEIRNGRVVEEHKHNGHECDDHDDDGGSGGGNGGGGGPVCRETGNCELTCDLSNRRYKALDIINIINEF